MKDENTSGALTDISALNLQELAALLRPHSVPAYRAKQIFNWIHGKLVTDFAAMSNLPQALRSTLATEFTFTSLEIHREFTSGDGTKKYLFMLEDGNVIETVYIPGKSRSTVCVSTMVGCPFGCEFCASGKSGFVRNLTASEIIQQVYRVQAALPEGQRVSNVVYMGMGEPLANYDPVLRSVRLLIHPDGLNLAQRHITISTVGVLPGMERLSHEGLQVTLAISLHAPTQQQRQLIVPSAKKYPIDEIITSARHYVQRTGRKVTFEYTLVPGRNDGEHNADALAKLLRYLQCMVNVIPVNPTDKPDENSAANAKLTMERAERFVEYLANRHLEVALRHSRGVEIAGACGQLRRQEHSKRVKSE